MRKGELASQMLMELQKIIQLFLEDHGELDNKFVKNKLKWDLRNSYSGVYL